MPTEITTIALLLFALALATYLQTITGFAFGLVAMGLIAAINLYPLDKLTFIVSCLSMVNTSTALRGQTHLIDRRLLITTLLACIPSTITGLWLLLYLNDSDQSVLKLILGATLLIFAGLMTFKPKPLQKQSDTKLIGFTGFIAGFSGGMFSAYGPPIALLFYRQPLPLKVLITTLLAVFWSTSLIRISTVMVMDTPTIDLIWLIAICVPWIILCTQISKRLPLPFTDTNMRRMSFGIVIVAGVSLIIGNIYPGIIR